MSLHSAHVIGWDQRIVDSGPFNPDSPQCRYRLLAEGDSWFTLGGLPTSNLLFSLRFPAPAIVVNCAVPAIRYGGWPRSRPTANSVPR